MAHNGTLFLTEIGDLPISLQAKLLTFLDDKEVFPLGSTRGFLSDVRVIAATNLNLERSVLEGSFRKDLLFRLNVLRIHLPPLRHRQGDIQLLLDHFLHVVSTKLGKKNMRFSKNAIEILSAYPYPGNVRELRNIIEYAVHICRQRKITPRHLPFYLAEPTEHEKDIPEHTSPQNGSFQSVNATIPATAAGRNWAQIERQVIIQALRQTGGRKNKAAEALGWARSTLWRKMKQHEIM
jgi:transcriptional regulator with PAS, ATPase and Fis domain